MLDSIPLKFQEFEYKYIAECSFEDFKIRMKALGCEEKAQHTTWDIYYSKSEEATYGTFLRLRLDPQRPELTKKIKLNISNNWQRIEADLPLDATRLSAEAVSFYVGLDGYIEDFRILKTCSEYSSEHLNYSFYSVMSVDWELLGTFIEIEVAKASAYLLKDPLEELNKGELALVSLEVNKKKRLSKSLFEMFRKV